MVDCPKCRGRMSPGFVMVQDSGSAIKWYDGEWSFWNLLGFGGKASNLKSARCSECGFIEFYADTTARPPKTLTTVDEETRRLNQIVAKLQERLAVLERIATDPAERTAREIEALRDLPFEDEDPSTSGRT